MKKFLFPVIVLMFIAGNSIASVIGPGSIELTGDAAFQHSAFSENAGSMTQLQLNGGALFAASQVMQFGVGLLYHHESVEPTGIRSVSRSSFGAEAMLRFNIGASKSVIPFFGAGLGVLSWSGDGYESASTTILPSITLGWRFLIRDAASFNVSVSYVHQSNALGVEDLSSNTILLGLGFSVFPNGFGGK